ncbi:hypothetical protein T484DRAFT_1763349 [Baffinella frigidus]|nr:hypothetical protein T484DRAFT_1763349 [Cryptophyta sp. CCMP2293]
MAANPRHLSLLLSAVLLSSSLAGLHPAPGQASSQRRGQAPSGAISCECNALAIAPVLKQEPRTTQLRLRGGAERASERRGPVVLPPPGPPLPGGELRTCAHCSALETASTLALCMVTDLHFCRGGDCRRDHWRENKEVWRDAMAAKAKPTTTHSGMPLPVEPAYTRDGTRIDDVNIFPGTGERDSPEPEREFGEMAKARDPKLHKWDEANDGVNRVLWDAAGTDNVDLMHQVLWDAAGTDNVDLMHQGDRAVSH